MSEYNTKTALLLLPLLKLSLGTLWWNLGGGCAPLKKGLHVALDEQTLSFLVFSERLLRCSVLGPLFFSFFFYTCILANNTWNAMLTCKENLYTDVLGSSESNLRNVWLFLNSCRHYCIPRSCSIVVKKKNPKPCWYISFLSMYVSMYIYLSCYHLCAAAYAGCPNSTTWSDIKVLFHGTSVLEPKALIKNSVAAECKLCY